MTKSRIVAWLALALMQVSAIAAAQDMSFDLEETSKPRGKKRGRHHRKPAATAPKQSAPEEEAPVISPDDETPGADTAADTGADAPTETGTAGSLIGDLAADDATAPKSAADSGPKPTEISEEIYAVQQIYALRNNRLELMPSVGVTLNDPYVTHPNVGVGLNYWITNVLAVGANFNWYGGLDEPSELNFHVQRSTRLGTRPTAWQFGASLNMTYVPVYGKFAMFERYIFQWDAYIVGGVGIMRTKPAESVVDPQVRDFDFTYKLSIVNPGLGLRVFVSKWLAVFAEGRVYPYLEKLENLRVGLGETARNDKKTWLDDSSTLIFNVVASVGVSIYFPFSFEYKLPK